MSKLKKLCALALIVPSIMLSAHALGAQTRQISITSDTTSSELLNDLDWLDTSRNGYQSQKFRAISDIVTDTYYYGISREDIFSAITDGSLIRLPQYNIDYIYSMMFSALDKFSYYLPPMFNSVFDDPQYTGYGIVIYDANRNKYASVGEGLFIEEVYADSPAGDAGVKPHDQVYAVNGIKVQNLTLNALTSLLSSFGDDETVVLTVLREGQTLDFALHKKVLPAKELTVNYYPQYSTAKLDISAFNSSTLQGLFEQAVEATYKAGYKNLIIDLRGNPGGVVDYAMKVTDFLITQQHNLFTFLDKNGLTVMSYTSDEAGYDFDRLYILVDEDTASAAEAMTIALKSLSGAIVVGNKTYGKEVGQVLHSLDDNSCFAVTTIRGYGPNGEDYNTIGIQPDYEVSNATSEFALPSGYRSLKAEQLALICEGGDSEAILALEQRFSLLNQLPNKYVDGVYDENLDACIKILQTSRGMEWGTLQPELLTYIDKTIESYLGMTISPEDNQLDFLMNLITGKVR